MLFVSFYSWKRPNCLSVYQCPSIYSIFAVPELEDPYFMPFKFKDEAHFTRPARTGMKKRNEEGLRDLLYHHTYNKGRWLSKAKQLLGVPNEAPEVSLLQQLMGWQVYND